MNNWERTDGKIEILYNYGAEISCDDVAYTKDRDSYIIEFLDENCAVVETLMKKSEFKGFPYEVSEGVWFSLVVFKDGPDSKEKAEAWPIPRHWSTDLLTRYDLSRKEKKNA